MLVAICFQFFGPYHVARIAAAARCMESVGVEFHAATKEYAWTRIDQVDFNRVVVDAGTGGDRRGLKGRIWEAFDRIAPDVIAVPGWGNAECLAAISWAQHRQIPVVMMSETTSWDSKHSALGEYAKRRVLASVQAALVGGTPHAEYARSLGLDAGAVFVGYDVVDNDYFAASAARERELGQPHAFPSAPYFLASSRFIPKKNLARVFEAFARYRHGGGQWELVVVGDGPLRDGLRAQRSALGLDMQIHLPGFVQYADLPRYYAWAGAFVHASTVEPWGLVVNEAMACGLPVIVSDRCGCAADLVQAPINGTTFNPYDVAAVTAAMTEIASNAAARTRMGRESSRIIQEWSPARFGQNLHMAVEVAARKGQRPLAPIDNLLMEALLWRYLL